MTIRVGIVTAPHIDYEKRTHSFVIHNVRIGIGFHWDQTEDEEFEGELEILHNADGTETAVNIIDLESYISCVICSEMSADSPLELLKAHAVISRSWVLRNLGHTGHVGFDVCADDHCQRYNGIRRRSARALQAVKETEGQVLVSSLIPNASPSGGGWEGASICDCRYHKCCGGRTELYSTCWEDRDYPYLQSVECSYCDPLRLSAFQPFSLSASRLFAAAPLCLSASQPLNDYDCSTANYHDWVVEYTQEELSEIVRTKTGTDFGLITDLIPLHRGASGRIDRLEIVGTRHREVIGKELRIRQALSPTTLYSSWFEIFSSPAGGGREGASFTFTGHGWGHGVGLCQIGAAAMAEQGFTYRQILAHYYRNTEISNLSSLISARR